MEAKNFTSKESLELIAQMISETKKGIAAGSGALFISRSGTGLIGRIGGFAVAAGGKGEQHNSRQNQRKNLFHFFHQILPP